MLCFRFSESETKVAALEESVSKLREEKLEVAQCIEAEVQVRQQLIDTSKRLESYQNVYGQTSSFSPEVQALSEQLEKKEQELQVLRLQDVRHVEVCKFIIFSVKQNRSPSSKG